MYYIYHIPGHKIGCSKTPAERVAKQGYTQFDVLEVHSDINEASKREIELQKEYGYEVDHHLYSRIVTNLSTKESCRKGAMTSNKARRSLTFEQAEEIRRKVKSGIRQIDICDEYNISKPMASLIVNRKRYLEP